MSLSHLSVSPNPASTKVQVTGGKNQLVVFGHINGDTLTQVRLDPEGKGEMDLSTVPSGVYLVRCGRSVKMVVKE